MQRGSIVLAGGSVRIADDLGLTTAWHHYPHDPALDPLTRAFCSSLFLFGVGGDFVEPDVYFFASAGLGGGLSAFQADFPLFLVGSLL